MNEKKQKDIFEAINLFVRLVIAILVEIILIAVGVWLWNILMPLYFGLGTITFWKFFGLTFLLGILLPGNSGGASIINFLLEDSTEQSNKKEND